MTKSSEIRTGRHCILDTSTPLDVGFSSDTTPCISAGEAESSSRRFHMEGLRLNLTASAAGT